MFYYLDDNKRFQGPYSDSAFEKWYENYFPAGTILYDENKDPCPIEYVVNKSLKSRTRVMFHDESLSARVIMNQTNLDVTLHLNSSDVQNTPPSSVDDFTQLEGGVDEVDLSGGFEYEARSCFLRSIANNYIVRRPLHNRRRIIPDAYCPFEFSWKNWVPEPIENDRVLRGAIHLHNLVQNFEEKIFSGYLRFLNIYPHPCNICNLKFANSRDMFLHFLSVIHIQRSCSNGHKFSYIDLHCARKIFEDVELFYDTRDFYYLTEDVHQLKQQPSFFDDFDIRTAFESLKSTVIVMQRVPLLNLPRDKSDTCEYVETILLFRMLQEKYSDVLRNVRGRRFSSARKTQCNYCKMEFDATYLESVFEHLLSDQHTENALHFGIARSDMEYWLLFIGTVINGDNRITKQPDQVKLSLQENDFPLCYQSIGALEGDFRYTGNEIQPVLKFSRDKISSQFALMEDKEYRTICRWCHVEIFTRNGVIRHILYEKVHLEHLTDVSNDDLRRLFRSLEIKVTGPLFHRSNTSVPMWSHWKGFNLQRIQNVCCRKLNKGLLNTVAARSFPLGLVNWCELCQTSIKRVDGIFLHLGSNQHTGNVKNNFQISSADITYWLAIFNVDGGLQR